MPTEYTKKIEKGVSFKQFALNCARNFGATIMLMGEPEDILPDTENVKSTNIARRQEKLDNAIKELGDFLNKTQAEIHVEFVVNRLEKIKYLTEILENKRKLRAKYEKMLVEVRNWVAPTEDHFDLKEFMIEQIELSIEFDYNEEYALKQLGKERNKHQADYYWDKYMELNRDIEYHIKHISEDIGYDEKRSEWVKDLIDSLPGD